MNDIKSKIKNKLIALMIVFVTIIIGFTTTSNALAEMLIGAMLDALKSTYAEGGYQQYAENKNYIMTDQGWQKLKDNMGKNYSYDGTVPWPDTVAAALVLIDNSNMLMYPWMHCGHPTSAGTGSEAYTFETLYAVMETGATKEKSDTLTNFTLSGGKLIEEDLGSTPYAIKMACWSLISKDTLNVNYKGNNGDLADRIFQWQMYMGQIPYGQGCSFSLDYNLGSLWSDCFRLSATNRSHFSTTYTNCDPDLFDGDNMPPEVLNEYYYNMAAYAMFVDQVTSGNGKAIEVADDMDISIDGDTVKGIVFSKFATDDGHDYAGQFDAFKDIDPNYTVTVEAELKDGSKVTSGIVITDASGKTVKPDEMKAGVPYNFKVPGSSKQNPVVKFKMKASYELIHARMACMMPPDGTTQSRTFTGAEKVPYTDEIEFEVTEPKDPVEIPIIVIKKTDQTGSALDNAVFTAKIENLTTGASKTITGLKTNEAGEVYISSDQLEEVGIDEIYGTDMLAPDTVGKIIGKGNLRITLTETSAPAGYKKINGNLVINATYEDGKIVITSSDTVVDSEVISYLVVDSANKEKRIESRVGVITVKIHQTTH